VIHRNPNPRHRFASGATTLVVACILFSTPAWAQGRILPVEEMARKADVIGVATVDSARAHEEPRTGFINTDFHLTFSEVWKGEAGPAFILMKPGGEVPGRKAAVPGQEFDLKPGEKIVVFATPSSLGNHVVMGLRQGLYRVGSGENPPLYRISEFPYGPGKESRLTLGDLRNEVYTALGKPVESRPAPKAPETPGAPPEKKAESPAPAPSPEKTAGTQAPPAADTSGRWIGGLAVCLFLAALIIVIIWKRKAKSQG
jgi:hypothetical protein